MFRRDLVLGLGAFDEALWYTADWDLWLKLAAHGPTTFLPEPLTAFRVHRCSQTWLFCEDEDEFRRQMELVRDRHLPLWEAGRRVDHGLRRVSRFSIEVNVRLAALSHGRSAGLIGLAASFLSLGPLGWHDYLTNSRVAERRAGKIKSGCRQALIRGWRSARQRRMIPTTGFGRHPHFPRFRFDRPFRASDSRVAGRHCCHPAP